VIEEKRSVFEDSISPLAKLYAPSLLAGHAYGCLILPVDTSLQIDCTGRTRVPTRLAVFSDTNVCSS
jgi:hypothetical protein